MKSKETPTNGRKKQGHNKLRSQIKNIVVRAIIKYNERNKIYNSCSLQAKQIIEIFFFCFFIQCQFFNLFASYITFLSLGVWDPKLTKSKLGDRIQLWPVLTPVTVNYFHRKAPSQV